MKLNLNNNDNIKIFVDVARLVELEENCLDLRDTEKAFLDGIGSKGAL